MKRLYPSLVLPALVILAGCGYLDGDEPSYRTRITVTGTVTEEDGTPIEGAQVSIRHVGAGGMRSVCLDIQCRDPRGGVSLGLRDWTDSDGVFDLLYVYSGESSECGQPLELDADRAGYENLTGRVQLRCTEDRQTVDFTMRAS